MGTIILQELDKCDNREQLKCNDLHWRAFVQAHGGVSKNNSAQEETHWIKVSLMVAIANASALVQSTNATGPKLLLQTIMVSA